MRKYLLFAWLAVAGAVPLLAPGGCASKEETHIYTDERHPDHDDDVEIDIDDDDDD